MFEKIDISVVTYNSEKWIPMFMDSLAKQNYPAAEINLFFTDNGSKDSTVALLNEYQQKYKGYFASFHIFKRENDGFGAGHNYNVKNGSSNFILVTNLDLEFDDEAIVNIVKAALEDTEKTASWELFQKPYEHPKDYNPVTKEVSWSSSACILFRREAFESVGGYEERIFMYGEDVEISYRLRDRGYILKYIPAAVCWHYAYEHKNQVKKIQLYGSLETNLCLRIRYGSVRDIMNGFLMYFSLFFVRTDFEDHRRQLIKHLKTILSNCNYYYSTRKSSDIRFNFLLWDYEIRRDGAFYEFKKHEEYKDKPKVSVVIRTYAGRLELLKQAVGSVVGQTYKAIEVIVVEDGSNEAEGYLLNLSEENSSIEIKYSSVPKKGRCEAGNKGLELSSGLYICFLDDDDLLYADHIETLVDSLLENEHWAAAYSSSFEVPTKMVSLSPLCMIEKEKQVFYRQTFSRFLLWQQNYIPIQSILFKRSLYEKHGGFDHSLDNLEDWNLWTRYSANEEFGYVEKTTSLYRVPMETDDKVLRQKKMNEYYQSAIDKQSQIMTTLSISDVRMFAEEYAKNKTIRRRMVRKTADLMRRNKITANVFVLIRKVYFKVKK